MIERFNKLAKRNSSRPRIVVIGTGRMAIDFHLPSLQHLESIGQCELGAVCDINASAAAAAAKKFGAKASYNDYRQMLSAEKPDGVVVITPLPVTAPVASDVLRQGYPVLMEKPPGDSVKACRKIIAAAGKLRRQNMVAFNRRYCPVLVQGREEAGRRGAIKGASAQMYRTKREDEIFFFGTGIHSLDALRYLGGEMDYVVNDTRVLARGERPAFSLLIGYRNGAAGTLVIRPQAGVQLERYEVFSADCVTLIKAGVGWLIDTPGSCTVYESNKEVKVPDALKPYARFKGDLRIAAVGGFYGEEARFVAALRGEAPFSPTVEESLQSVEIAEAVQAGKSWKRRS
jgi:myo-inositol 2-dehydrogenase / D-chiro-inositol 1-dehydrogenase